jgi:cupin fold WbuC family metalloprotein
MMIQLIDTALLDQVCREAAASPRRRKNRNFHPSDDYPAHRLLNAIEPGSYIRPHRHLDPNKDETMVVLRGRLGVALFDDAGLIARAAVLGAGADAVGIDIAHGTWHTVFALEPGTVFLEAKAGPYRPLGADEAASWAPEEGAPDAAAYLAALIAAIGSP